MSMSNIEYSALKKKAGLHNWGFLSSKDQFDFDLDELEEMDIEEMYSPDLVHQNNYGEYYALQDFEE
jgi:hypothetical protein